MFEGLGGPGGPILKVFGQDGESIIRSIFVERCDFALSHVLNNRLPIRAPNVFHKVKAALLFMHLQHVAYCDVKPSNILRVQLTSRAVLCDFILTVDFAFGTAIRNHLFHYIWDYFGRLYDFQ